MNAYELADYFEYELKDVFPYCILTIRMLREQADRIAELEKQTFFIADPEKQGEPVAWMSPDGKVSTTEGILFHIPLYTTPQTKLLSDEEIQKMWKGNVESCGWESVFQFARAIEERHGIK